MSLPLIPKAQPNWPFGAPVSALKQNGLAFCTDGSDGYPTLENFTSQMEKYLSGKKRAERTVITSSDLHQIHKLLLDPAALRADPNPSNRAWVKKSFFLEATPSGTMVCHREKGQRIGRPIAVKELIYFILKEAHASEGHGGRDKTAKAVKNTHSYIRKGLICIFLETCPTCQTRIEAAKKERYLTLDKSLNMPASRDSIVSFGTGFLTPITSPTNFEIKGNIDRATSLFQSRSNPQLAGFSQPSYMAINRPTMPPELALVPAAPNPGSFSRSRNASFPPELSSNSRKGQRMFSAASNLGEPSIPPRHLHSPYPFMPNTIIASDITSRYSSRSSQSQKHTGLDVNLVTPMAEGLAPTSQQSASSSGELCAWSHQSQTPTLPLGSNPDSANWEIEFADIWTGNEPNLNFSLAAPLIQPQPRLPSSELLKISFMDQFFSTDNSNLEFNSSSSISPMTNVFPG